MNGAAQLAEAGDQRIDFALAPQEVLGSTALRSTDPHADQPRRLSDSKHVFIGHVIADVERDLGPGPRPQQQQRVTLRRGTRLMTDLPEITRIATANVRITRRIARIALGRLLERR